MLQRSRFKGNALAKQLAYGLLPGEFLFIDLLTQVYFDKKKLARKSK